MEAYNVMVTQANTRLGCEFVRQLIVLPYPPGYVFASYADDDTLNDLLSIKESCTKSKVIIIKMDCQVLEDVCEVRTTIEKLTRNQGLDFIINVIGFKNEDRLISTKILERQFREYTLPQLLLFQTMIPLLAASLHSQESKAVFFNITEDNTVGSDPVFEVNKIALNLSMNAILDKIQKEHILLLSTCLNTQEKSHSDETEIENSVGAILFYAFCCYQVKREYRNHHSIEQL